MSSHVQNTMEESRHRGKNKTRFLVSQLLQHPNANAHELSYNKPTEGSPWPRLPLWVSTEPTCSLTSLPVPFIEI